MVGLEKTSNGATTSLIIIPSKISIPMVGKFWLIGFSVIFSCIEVFVI